MSTAFKPQENDAKFSYEKQEEDFDNFDNENNQIYENGTKNIEQNSNSMNYDMNNSQQQEQQHVEYQEKQSDQFNDVSEEFKQDKDQLMEQENNKSSMQYDQQQPQEQHQFISNKLKRSQSVSSQIFDGLNIYVQITDDMNDKEEDLIQKIKALGGNPMSEYSQECNILIWIDGTPYKFSKVQNTDILYERWIHDCYEQNQKLSYNNYRFQPPKEFILQGQNSEPDSSIYSEDQLQKKMKREQQSPSMSAYLGPTNSRIQKDQISEFSLEDANQPHKIVGIKNSFDVKLDQSQYNDDIYNNHDQNPSLPQIQGDLITSQSHTNIGSSNNNQGRWTTEEHNRFVEALRIYGKNWKKVEEHVGSRSGAQIRSHAQKFFIKQEREYKKQNTTSIGGMNNSNSNNIELSTFQNSSPKIESNGGSQNIQNGQLSHKKANSENSDDINLGEQQQKKREPKSASKPAQFQNKQPVQASSNSSNQNLNLFTSKEENEIQRSNKSLQHIKGINEAISKNQQQQNEQQRNKVISNDQFKMPSQQPQPKVLQPSQIPQQIVGAVVRQENNTSNSNNASNGNGNGNGNGSSNGNGNSNASVNANGNVSSSSNNNNNLKDEDNVLQIEPTHYQETDEVFDDSDYNQHLQGLLNTYNQWNSRHNQYQQLDDDYTPLEFLQNAPPNYPRQDDTFADFQSSSIIHEIQKEQDIPETQNFSKPHRHSVDLDQNEIQILINDQSKSANNQFILSQSNINNNNIKNNPDIQQSSSTNKKDIQSQQNKLKVQTQILTQDIFPGSKFKGQ